MFQKGEYVIYGSTGVCRIVDVGVPDILKDTTDKQHYTLCPVYREETIYTPVDTAVFIRPVMDSSQAEKFIATIPHINGTIDMNLNSKTLREKYRSMIDSHSCDDLVILIKFIKAKIAKAQRDKRKPNEVDQDYLKKAQSLLYGELSIAFDIPYDDVPRRINMLLSSIE